MHTVIAALIKDLKAMRGRRKIKEIYRREGQEPQKGITLKDIERVARIMEVDEITRDFKQQDKGR